MDIKHILYSSSTRRSFRTAEAPVGRSSANHLWFALPAGLFEVGHGSEDFSYDNERPSHKYYHDHSIICGDLVTQQEYLEFIEAGGYQEPKYWLSDGWKYIQDEKITAPLYWEKAGSGWQKFSLSGMQPISANDPVSHVSFYEASAFAEFKKLRLPREQEWELAAKTIEKPEEYFSYDKLWEWTMSPYSPYPGYKKYDGSLGEYNAKFMCNQFVLKGGSFATPFGHSRASYRNFYYPTDRWQFSGFRLAKDEN